MPRIVLKELETDKAQAVADIEASLGRDPACGFVIEGPKSKVVSGRHARIFYQDHAWWIQDTSRNGTVLDSERLQSGQRHALKVGQVIGLGESGPRLRVAELESRTIVQTIIETPEAAAPPEPTPAPQQAFAAMRPTAITPASGVPVETTAMRRSEAIRAGLSFEGPTEPTSPSPDWLVHVVMRATNMNQRFEARALVVTLGRSPDCHIRVAPELGASVSRVHAEIAIYEGGVVIRDAGSRNGTFLNGNRIETPRQATKADLIMLGSGGPTFAIEDLHIVKGPTSSQPSAGSGSATPPQAKPGLFGEPPTAPASRGLGTHLINASPNSTAGGAPATALLASVLDDVSDRNAQKVRIAIWAVVGALLLGAVVVLGFR